MLTRATDQILARITLDGGVRIAYRGESTDDAVATVRTTVGNRHGRSVPFDYRMIKRGARWAVRDVVVDGVSLVENYRAQFVKTIHDGSYQELILRMKAKAADVPERPEVAAVVAPQRARGDFRPAPMLPGSMLKDAHFGSDAFAIGAAAAKILDENAAWLKAHPHARVRLEGQTDPRGTGEANLELGERRARAAQAYLVAQGVEASRISIVSHGDARPVCTERTEACWAMSRRVRFLVTP